VLAGGRAAFAHTAAARAITCAHTLPPHRTNSHFGALGHRLPAGELLQLQPLNLCLHRLAALADSGAEVARRDAWLAGARGPHSRCGAAAPPS
jgi:hypothetical protein